MTTSIFPPPPTYADPTIVDERTGKNQFNPIWLKWFLDVAQIMTQLGGNALAAGQHNQLKGLQGGDGTNFVHVTPTQFNGLLVNPMTTAGDLIIGGSVGSPTRLAAGGNGTTLTIVAGLPAWV
jgi:hypothetical protein